jgi:hypothetical protein
MAQAKYRKVPMYQQVPVGARVKRIQVPGLASLDREGTVVGPAVEKGRSNWYLPVHWDGCARPENVHVARLEWLEGGDG